MMVVPVSAAFAAPTTTSTLTLNTQALNGTKITGFYSELLNSAGKVAAKGYSPKAYTLTDGATYTVEATCYNAGGTGAYTLSRTCGGPGSGATGPQIAVNLIGDPTPLVPRVSGSDQSVAEDCAPARRWDDRTPHLATRWKSRGLCLAGHGRRACVTGGGAGSRPVS